MIPGDFSKKNEKTKNEKNKKKTKKRENHRVRRFYGVRRSCRVRGFYSMCTSLAVECDALAGVRRICGMRRIPSMRGWYRDHIGKFRGQNQNSNPKASPNFQGHTVGSIFPSSPWVRSRGRNLLIFTQPTFKNVTFDNPVLSFFGRQMRKFPYQSSLQFIQRPQLLWNDIGDRKLWRGIQWIRRGPTVPSRLS